MGDSAWLYYFRARCYLTYGREDLALADLRHALTLPTGLNTLKQEHALQLIAELEAKQDAS